MPDTRIFRFSMTLAVVAAGALALAGCGRRGPLEPPPAALTGPAAAEAQPAPPLAGALFGQPDAQPSADAAFGPDGLPIAGKSTKKTFILDPLID